MHRCIDCNKRLSKTAPKISYPMKGANGDMGIAFVCADCEYRRQMK